LLDLQQKEASLAEVRSSNRQAELAADQAEETQAQSRILMLFTVVTIIFVSAYLKRAQSGHVTYSSSSFRFHSSPRILA
jgi:uncharacterized membrane protein (DUF106 family)